MADRVQLQQVFMNLMLNGIDAMKDVADASELTIKSQQVKDGQLLISVSDTGVGLPPNRQTRFSGRSSLQRLTARAWDCPSAGPSLSRMEAVCGHSRLRAGGNFSFHPACRGSRPMYDKRE